jgi:hypothetical protein
MLFKNYLPLSLVLFFLTGCGTGSSPSASGNPRNPFGAGPAGVSLAQNGGNLVANDLGSAGSYVILAKTGISNVTGGSVVGNIGVSPAAASYITGYTLTADASNEFSTTTPGTAVVGKVYAANYSQPTPSNLTTAIGSMETAYSNASGRTPPDVTEEGAGNISGLTLTPNLYKWGTSVTIPTAVTLSGGPNDVWIFQIAGDLNLAGGISVLLAGGAQAKNIFWQVAGQVTIGAGAHFEGIILCKTAVVVQTNASMNGRIYAQTAVTLDNNNITQQ